MVRMHWTRPIGCRRWRCSVNSFASSLLPSLCPDGSELAQTYPVKKKIFFVNFVLCTCAGGGLNLNRRVTMRIVVCLCSCGWRVSGTKTSKSSEISQLPVQNPFRAQRKTQRQETMRIVVFLNFLPRKNQIRANF